MKYSELLRKRLGKYYKKQYKEYLLMQKLKGEPAESYKEFEMEKLGHKKKYDQGFIIYDEYFKRYPNKPKNFPDRGGVKKKGKTKYLRN